MADWIDEAKKKAEEAKKKAALEAGKAVVKATLSAAKKSAESLVEGVLSAAEGELAEQTQARGERKPLVDDAKVPAVFEELADNEEDNEAVQKEDRAAAAEARRQGALEQLARMKADHSGDPLETTRAALEKAEAARKRASEQDELDLELAAVAVEPEVEECILPVITAEPEVDLLLPPAPEAVLPEKRDPFEDAQDALRQAAAARGVVVEGVPELDVPCSDPFGDVEALLERAARARGVKPGPLGTLKPKTAEEVLAEAAAARGAKPIFEPTKTKTPDEVMAEAARARGVKHVPLGTARRKSPAEVLAEAARIREEAMKGKRQLDHEWQARKELTRLKELANRPAETEDEEGESAPDDEPQKKRL